MATQTMMDISSFQWDESYSVGVATIDAQHQKIFKEINALIKLLDTRPSLGTMEAVVDDMIDYVGTHFATEERFLSKHPQFGGHQAKHEAFSRRIREFDRQLFSSKPEAMALSLFLFLGAWLHNHILTEDQAYFAYLRKNSLLPSTP